MSGRCLQVDAMKKGDPKVARDHSRSRSAGRVVVLADLGSHQLSQHERQDAAMAEILNLDAGIDSQQQLDTLD